MVVGAVLDGEAAHLLRLGPAHCRRVQRSSPSWIACGAFVHILQFAIVAESRHDQPGTRSPIWRQHGWPYIGGGALRRQKEVRDQVLADQAVPRGHRRRENSTAWPVESEIGVIDMSLWGVW